MAEIFREIDEELRQDKLKEQWDKYGRYLVGLAILVVGSVAGYKAWQAYTEQQRADAALAFQSALIAASNAEYEEAAGRFGAIVESGPEGYGVLARMRRATVFAEAGNNDLAATAFEEISSDGAVPPLFQELALIRMAMVQSDTGDAGALISRLEPLAAAGKPWRYAALELIVALQLKTGQIEEARKGLTALADDFDAPTGSRGRAAELLRALP